jgi:major membrane immunogen (membrane-anchored lipoprotein)
MLPLFLAGVCPGCAPEDGMLQDGYYSAISDSYNEAGWKDFITLYIYNNKIVTAEYNARNASGLVLSWDSASLRGLQAETRLHPDLLIRVYIQDLLTWQDPQRIRRIPADTYVYETFKKLAIVATEQAKIGNRAVAQVRVAENSPVRNDAAPF